MKSKNPFRVLFLCITGVCCVVLSIGFLCISYKNEKKLKEIHAMERTEEMMSEWETQLFAMKEMALRIVSNYEFQPYYFQKDIAKELSMLETFKQYKYCIALTEDYFLDYGEEWIYRSGGTTTGFNIYINEKTDNVEEQKRFRYEVEKIKSELTKTCGEPVVLSFFDELYVMVPLKINKNNGSDCAILGFVVQKNVLEKRLKMAGAGMEGGMTLYGEDGILYTNQKQPSVAGQSNVISVTSGDGHYTLCYLLEKDYNFQNSLMIMVALLGVADVLLIFIVGNVFAQKAYRPIKELMQKKQKAMRNQTLCMVLDNNALGEIQLYLDDAEICLDGPFYCVVSISFEEESKVSTEFLDYLQTEIELIPDKSKKEYIYSVCNYEKKLLNLICSGNKENSIEYLIGMVCDVAESFRYAPIIGIGNAYQSLEDVSVSWMESMSTIQCSKSKTQNEQSFRNLIYGKDGLQRIILAMESGYEEMTMERLERFVMELHEYSISVLMLQYVWTEFLGEVHKLEQKYKIEIFTKNVNSFYVVKNVESFHKYAKKMIYKFFECYNELKKRKEEKIVNDVYEYMNEHFSEYDICIEKVASDLHTNTDIVREAILRRTGKLYRDYLIYLRIEYAKEILSKEDISVAELCQKVGYGNVSSFIRLFKEVVGVTPAKYKKCN